MLVMVVRIVVVVERNKSCVHPSAAGRKGCSVVPAV